VGEIFFFFFWEKHKKKGKKSVGGGKREKGGGPFFFGGGPPPPPPFSLGQFPKSNSCTAKTAEKQKMQREPQEKRIKQVLSTIQVSDVKKFLPNLLPTKKSYTT